eukprot:504090_1
MNALLLILNRNVSMVSRKSELWQHYYLMRDYTHSQFNNTRNSIILIILWLNLYNKQSGMMTRNKEQICEEMFTIYVNYVWYKYIQYRMCCDVYYVLFLFFL